LHKVQFIRDFQTKVSLGGTKLGVSLHPKTGGKGLCMLSWTKVVYSQPEFTQALSRTENIS
jgi:hypothetical protein